MMKKASEAQRLGLSAGQVYKKKTGSAHYCVIDT